MGIEQSITQYDLEKIPSESNPDSFRSNAAYFCNFIANLVSELETWGAEANALKIAMNAYGTEQLNQLGISYLWIDLTEQTAQAGMSVDDLGLRTDEKKVYKFNGTTWDFYFSLTNTDAETLQGLSAASFIRTWTPISGNTSANPRWYKICRLASSQGARLEINLVGNRSGYSAGAKSYFGKIVGQFDNDNIWYFEFFANNDNLVYEFQSLKIDTTYTDLYLKVYTYSEIQANYMISRGSLEPLTNVYTETNPNGTVVTINKIWTSLNSGYGSGLDADKVDGYNATTDPTSATVVVRDSQARVNAKGVYLAESDQSSVETGDFAFMFRRNNSTDNLTRFMTSAQFKTWLSDNGIPYIVDRLDGETGYKIWSNGDIEQWGRTTISGYGTTVTFPIEFQEQCDNVHVTAKVDANNGAYAGTVGSSITTTSFYYYNPFIPTEVLWSAKGK